jgi:hypothetical protein
MGMSLGLNRGIALNNQGNNRGPQVLILDESGNAILDEETGRYWAAFTTDVDEE